MPAEGHTWEDGCWATESNSSFRGHTVLVRKQDPAQPEGRRGWPGILVEATHEFHSVASTKRKAEPGRCGSVGEH